MSNAVQVGRDQTTRLGCFPPASKPVVSLMQPNVSAVTAVRDQLHSSPYADVRRIECKNHEGQIVLTGSVSNFFQKQVALAIIARHVPIELVSDELTVVHPGPARGAPPR